MVSQISTSCLIEYLRITTLSATAALKSENNANMPGSIPWGMLRDVYTPWFNSDTTLTSLLRGDLLAWEADAMRPRQDEISKHNKTLITKALFVYKSRVPEGVSLSHTEKGLRNLSDGYARTLAHQLHRHV